MENHIDNAHQATQSISKIIECVENLAMVTQAYNETLDSAFKQSDLIFIRKIRQAMVDVDTSLQSLSKDCQGIENTLGNYVVDVANAKDLVGS
ncbi:hypothetical protein [Cytobacillus sp. IB215316]|uniref:hypothetical protein n=1 Tax=Cytobacillus sp. IB215316 TaxID=3097354 RepID=UPI002A171104|nr:hypothetical protein [Cytobacillus sp. IB215316]MDX8360776.1 hypothetical protein [Cytobacillus sp. IB215316]